MTKSSSRKRLKRVSTENQISYIRRVIREQGLVDLKLNSKKLYQTCSHFFHHHPDVSTKKGKMLVIKTGLGYFKGQKIRDTEEINQILENPEIKFRGITYLLSKTGRQFCNDVAKCIDVVLPEQHGFTNRKGIYTTAKQLQKAPHVYQVANIDIENAFNGVPRQFIFLVFNRIFKLNKHHSKILTDMCVDETGYMYQGCPFAPQIFNLYAMPGIISIQKMGYGVAAYADDFSVYSTNPKQVINIDTILAIRMRLQFWNMKINKNKVKIYRKNPDFVEVVGLKIWDTKHSKNRPLATPLHLRRDIKKLRYFCHLFMKGIRNTRRLNVQGQPIELYSVIQGYYNWVTEHRRQYLLEWALIDRQEFDQGNNNFKPKLWQTYPKFFEEVERLVWSIKGLRSIERYQEKEEKSQLVSRLCGALEHRLIHFYD